MEAPTIPHIVSFFKEMTMATERSKSRKGSSLPKGFRFDLATDEEESPRSNRVENSCRRRMYNSGDLKQFGISHLPLRDEAVLGFIQ